jgi:glycosyltransferase involved in cell wall biosynthesis
MAALNAESEIERSIRSLLEQSYRQLEIIVVDDGSEDGTGDVVRAMARHDPRVRLVVNAQRRGAARARNRGLHEMIGAYVTFQDADDVSHPERIERQLAALIEADALICVCNSRRETEEGKRIVVNGRRFSKNFIAMMIPREPVFSRVGYMMNLRVGEDSEYYERAKAVFGKSREVHLFQTLYRQLFSSGSLLFSNSETRVGQDGRVEYNLADDVKLPLEDALQRLEKIHKRELSPFVPYND